MLIDCAPVLECLTEIWGSDKFTCSGYGGDFVLPVRWRPPARASMYTRYIHIVSVAMTRWRWCLLRVCVQTIMQGAVEYQGMHRDGGVEIKTADGPCTLQSVALHYDTFYR